MKAAERYARARATVVDSEVVRLSMASLWKYLHEDEARQGKAWRQHMTTDTAVLRLLISLDPFPGGVVEEHVSVSRLDGKVPTWDDLVAVRSVVWPDEAVVLQYMPAGDEDWVNVQGVEVLHLWRKL